jgi:hypothetical protein
MHDQSEIRAQMRSYFYTDRCTSGLSLRQVLPSAAPLHQRSLSAPICAGWFDTSICPLLRDCLVGFCLAQPAQTFKTLLVSLPFIGPKQLVFTIR